MRTCGWVLASFGWVLASLVVEGRCHRGAHCLRAVQSSRSARARHPHPTLASTHQGSAWPGGGRQGNHAFLGAGAPAAAQQPRHVCMRTQSNVSWWHACTQTRSVRWHHAAQANTTSKDTSQQTCLSSHSCQEAISKTAGWEFASGANWLPLQCRPTPWPRPSPVRTLTTFLARTVASWLKVWVLLWLL